MGQKVTEVKLELNKYASREVILYKFEYKRHIKSRCHLAIGLLNCIYLYDISMQKHIPLLSGSGSSWVQFRAESA